MTLSDILGAYVHGMFLEGARWDERAGTLADQQLKQVQYQCLVHGN